MHKTETNKSMGTGYYGDPVTELVRVSADKLESGYAEVSVVKTKESYYLGLNAFLVEGRLSGFVSAEVQQELFPLGTIMKFQSGYEKRTVHYASAEEAIASATGWCEDVEARWHEALVRAEELRDEIVQRQAKAEELAKADEAAFGAALDEGIFPDEEVERALDIAEGVRGVVEVIGDPYNDGDHVMADKPEPLSLRDQLRENAERFAKIAKKCLDEYDTVPSKEILEKAAIAHEAASTLVKSASPYEPGEYLDAPRELPSRAGILAGGHGVFGAS